MEKELWLKIKLSTVLLIFTGVTIPGLTGMKGNVIYQQDQIQSATDESAFSLEENQPNTSDSGQGSDSNHDVESTSASNQPYISDSGQGTDANHDVESTSASNQPYISDCGQGTDSNHDVESTLASNQPYISDSGQGTDANHDVESTSASNQPYISDSGQGTDANHDVESTSASNQPYISDSGQGADSNHDVESTSASNQPYISDSGQGTVSNHDVESTLAPTNPLHEVASVEEGMSSFRGEGTRSTLVPSKAEKTRSSSDAERTTHFPWGNLSTSHDDKSFVPFTQDLTTPRSQTEQTGVTSDTGSPSYFGNLVQDYMTIDVHNEPDFTVQDDLGSSIDDDTITLGHGIEDIDLSIDAEVDEPILPSESFDVPSISGFHPNSGFSESKITQSTNWWGKLSFRDDDFLDGWPFRSFISENIFHFTQKVVAVHIELCGTKCTFPHSPLMWERSSAVPSVTWTAPGCSSCFCDHLCIIYNDCCPDLQLLGYNFNNALLNRNRLFKKSIRFGNKPSACEYTNTNLGIFVSFRALVNDCPRQIERSSKTADEDDIFEQPSSADAFSLSADEVRAAAERLRAKCENREQSRHWDYIRPLTSREGLVYRNKFCAMCHGEDMANLTEWSTSIHCAHNVLHGAKTVADAYLLAANDSSCDVRFKTEKKDMKRDCQVVRPPLISTCNETGLWPAYDKNIERACEMYSSIVMAKYKNVFCYLCNTNASFVEALKTLQEWRHQYPDPAFLGRVSFSALLFPTEDGDSSAESGTPRRVVENMTATATKAGTQCDKGFVLDPLQCLCRPMQCQAGLRVDGNNCTEVLVDSNMYAFSICTRYRINAENAVSALQYRLTVQRHESAIRKHFGFQVLYHMQAVPRFACYSNKSLAVDVYTKLHGFEPAPFKQTVKSILRLLKKTTDTSARMTVESPAPGCLDPSVRIQDVAESCPTDRLSTLLGVLDITSLEANNAALTRLYNTTLCPHVNLTEAEFSNYSSRLQGLGLSKDNVTFDATFVNSETFYLLCAEDFLKIHVPDTCMTKTTMPRQETQEAFQDSWTVLGLMSLVSTCISLFSLLCVMVTYIALPALRTGTGLSTLAMACLLFWAQALHELGLEQYEIRQLCLVLALLIHFSWLSAVFMMTSCTLQLFAAIVFPLEARIVVQGHGRKTLALSLAFSLGTAASVVGMTMLANQLTYGDLGYPAEHLCFIKRGMSKNLGFGLPLGLAVLVNIVLVIAAFVHLKRAPRLSGARKHRLSLVACFRLSVITGACWLSLFLMALPGTRPWLEYVFVVLLGSQGLLLATTLLLNPRVFGLWREKTSRRPPTTVSSVQPNNN